MSNETRVRVNTKWGSYYSTKELQDKLMSSNKNVQELINRFSMLSFEDQFSDTLAYRIDGNMHELIKLSKKEKDLSLEDIVSVFHSLIHKVSEGIKTGNYKQARRAYSIIQNNITQFELPL